MFVQVEVLIGCVNYDGVVVKFVFIEVIEDLFYVFVYSCYVGQVILYVVLIFLLYECRIVYSGVKFCKFFIYRAVDGILFLFLFFGEVGVFVFEYLIVLFIGFFYVEFFGQFGVDFIVGRYGYVFQ